MEYVEASPDTTLEQAKSILAKSTDEDVLVLTLGDGATDGGIGVVELPLIQAFHFLVNHLMNQGCAVDHYLAENLAELYGEQDEYASKVMRAFVNFRRSMGAEISEDDQFLNNSDYRVYANPGTPAQPAATAVQSETPSPASTQVDSFQDEPSDFLASMNTVIDHIAALDEMLVSIKAKPSKIEGYLYRHDNEFGHGGLVVLQSERYFMMRDLLRYLLYEGELVELAKQAQWDFVDFYEYSPNYKKLLREFLAAYGWVNSAPELLSPTEWPTSPEEEPLPSVRERAPGSEIIPPVPTGEGVIHE